MKLSLLGVQGLELSWFKSYLTNRKQQTFTNGILSTPELITYGVPQGSVIGTLLFLIYINGLPGCLTHSIANMYADDTSITLSDADVNQIETEMNTDLNCAEVMVACRRVLKSSVVLHAVLVFYLIVSIANVRNKFYKFYIYYYYKRYLR